jgi:hypothetical protein
MAENRSLVKDLFTQIEQRIFFGDRLKEKQFLSLSNPGQYVKSSLDESNLDDLFIQSALVDQSLAASWIYKEQVGRLSDIYGEILEFAKLPQLRLSPDERQEIKDLEQWIRDNMANYDRFGNRYEELADEYDYLSKENPTSPSLGRLLEKKNRYMRDWETLGRKLEYERKQARIIYLNSGDPNTWWLSVRELYDNSKKTTTTGGILKEFYPTIFFPAVADWSSSSWAKISMETYERDSSYYSRSTSWSAGAGAGWGLWTVGVSAGGSTREERFNTETERFGIEFEFLRVRLIRPWLKDSIFSLKSWAWKRIHDSTLLSDGGNIDLPIPIEPLGRMPVVVTSLLVARNLKISASWSEFDKELIQSSFRGGLSVGYGPFRLRGSYSQDSTSIDETYKFENNTLSIDAPQIIGYLGTVLPKCPDPDLTLPWETIPNLSPTTTDRLLKREYRALKEAEWQAQIFLDKKEAILAEMKKEIQLEVGRFQEAALENLLSIEDNSIIEQLGTEGGNPHSA